MDEEAEDDSALREFAFGGTLECHPDVACMTGRAAKRWGWSTGGRREWVTLSPLLERLSWMLNQDLLILFAFTDGYFPLHNIGSDVGQRCVN